MERVPNLDGRLLGRYRLLTHVASGGMASVHVARAEGTLGFERLVAVKLLHPHLAGEDEFVHMIADEARMAARIRNPKVVAVLDVDEDPDLGLYLVMDYVEGDHLGQLVAAARASNERIEPAIAVRIVLDLLEGLAGAHELVDAFGTPTPIVHRDVSPHNVLVGVDGMARLSDFGVAHAEARITQTREGRFKGKVAYMAPEQLADGVADARSDLFAAGIVLFETLTGERLFRAESTAQTLKKLLQDPIPRLDEVDPALAPLADVVARALARDPDERYPSARAMAQALTEAALASVGVAQPEAVARLVRAMRGLMLAERAVRIRASLEGVTASGETSLTPRRSAIPGTSTRPSIPSARRASSSIAPDAPDARAGVPRSMRRRVVLGTLALVAGASALLAVGRPWDGAPSHRPRVAAAVATAPIPDGDAERIAGEPPALAAERGIVTPSVVVRTTVAADGSVRSAEPFAPRPELAELERHAVAAVLGYRFRPAHRNGRAVESVVNLPIRFRRVEGTEHVVRIKGSDTIGGALTPALALAFRTSHPEIDVTVEALGSSTAFVGLFDGTADLGASSRPIRAAEAAEASRLGLALEETVVGYDGIAVIVHPSVPLTQLDLDRVAEIFSGRARTLDALDAGVGRWRLVGRPTYSGTNGFFADRVLSPRGLAFAEDVEAIEHSEAIVRAVAADPRAIAYVGASHVDATVKVLGIADPGGRPVLPDEASIRSGRYPIFRPLIVYSRGAPSGAAAEFLRFVLSPEGHAIVRAHGFLPSAATLGGEGRADAAATTHLQVERIPFAAGTTHVSNEGRARLRTLAERSLADASLRIYTIGHADSEGTEEDNVRIGLERARAVASALRALGVPRDRIVVESRGSTAPIATNVDAVGMARNRRVDVQLVRP